MSRARDTSRVQIGIHTAVTGADEFTYVPVHSLTITEDLTFDTANALTKWKFMQTPEYERLPDGVKHTVERECLTHYFNMMTYGVSNWKEKFTATIPIRDLNPCRAAAAYFCGAPLHVMEQTDIGYFKVMCPGYYECIGA